MSRGRLLWHGFVLMACALLGGCGSPTGPGGTESGFVESGNIQLRWVLDLPEGAGPFPAVVLGQGSGDITADQRRNRNRSSELTALGFAVIRYDKRGTGESGGVYEGLNVANSDALIGRLAGDMEAVLGVLQSRPEVDPGRIGLLGASQAKWVMALAASRHPEVGFLISISGGVNSVGVNNRFEELTQYDPTRIAYAEEELRSFQGPHGFDPFPHIESLDIPLLYLFGTADPVFALEHNLGLFEALHAGGAQLETRIYEGEGHGLKDVDFWGTVALFLEDVW